MRTWVSAGGTSERWLASGGDFTVFTFIGSTQPCAKSNDTLSVAAFSRQEPAVATGRSIDDQWWLTNPLSSRPRAMLRLTSEVTNPMKFCKAGLLFFILFVLAIPAPAQQLPPNAPSREQVMELFESDRKSTRLNSSHSQISYAVFCLKKK